MKRKRKIRINNRTDLPDSDMLQQIVYLIKKNKDHEVYDTLCNRTLLIESKELTNGDISFTCKIKQ